jgi:hypothetical protein
MGQHLRHEFSLHEVSDSREGEQNASSAGGSASHIDVMAREA